MFKFIKRLLAYFFTTPINPIKAEVTILPPQKDVEVKEISWFTRKNDLCMEFTGTPTKVSSSNFSEWESRKEGEEEYIKPEPCDLDEDNEDFNMYMKPEFKESKTIEFYVPKSNN